MQGLEDLEQTSKNVWRCPCVPPAWCARPSELRTAAIVAAWLAVAPESVHHFALPLCGRTGKRAAMKTSAITLYSHWRTLSVGMEVPGLLRRAPAGADASAGRQPQEAFVAGDAGLPTVWRCDARLYNHECLARAPSGCLWPRHMPAFGRPACLIHDGSLVPTCSAKVRHLKWLDLQN